VEEWQVREVPPEVAAIDGSQAVSLDAGMGSRQEIRDPMLARAAGSSGASPYHAAKGRAGPPGQPRGQWAKRGIEQTRRARSSTVSAGAPSGRALLPRRKR